MAERIRLEVVTPQRQVVGADVEEVRLPGVLGELGVLPDHTPLLTALGIGELAYSQDRKESHLFIRGGFAEVLADRVTVLAELAERPQEIDPVAAEAERTAAEAELKTAETSDEISAQTARLRSALARLQVASRANA